MSNKLQGEQKVLLQKVLDYLLTYLITYLLCLLTYLLIPWSRFFLEKPIVSQLVKKFPGFYESRTFITVFKTARQRFLSCARSIQSVPLPPLSTSLDF